MHEIEKIENESKLHATTAQSDVLMFKLITRVDKGKCVRNKTYVKLGCVTQRADRSKPMVWKILNRRRWQGRELFPTYEKALSIWPPRI